MSARPVVEDLGEAALLLRLQGDTAEQANARIHALAARLAQKPPPDVREIVPAWTSLAVLFDGGEDPAAVRARLHSWLLETLGSPGSGESPPPVREHRLEVVFGGECGEDLDDLARHARCPADEVVRRFCAAEYRVAMLGFAPGFPYLLGLDPSLALPRLATPRPLVPAGSVAIAERQAGIYPRPGPGGWRLLGRTAAVLFDAERSPPALLAAGDRVRFVPA